MPIRGYSVASPTRTIQIVGGSAQRGSKLKPNPKIYRHREYQPQGDLAEAMKKLMAELLERGWIEPSDSEWASPAFVVPKKEKGKWRLVVYYRGLNEQTEHDSYSLPLIDTTLQNNKKSGSSRW